jgi:hypothetical protein
LRVFGHHSAQRARLLFLGAFGGNSRGALVRIARAFRSRIAALKCGFSSCIFVTLPASSWNKVFPLAW